MRGSASPPAWPAKGLAARLQSPPVLALFALMLAGFALSMFDVYELRLPTALATRMTAHSQRLPAGQAAGVFAMGALSALIVSPCVSAPLAGALVFISQTRDVTLGGTALFSLAAGMSVPLMVVGGSAGDWLPKSGPWMTAVKRAFGVLLFAVAIWIVQPVLPASAVLGAWGLLLLVAGLHAAAVRCAAPQLARGGTAHVAEAGAGCGCADLRLDADRRRRLGRQRPAAAAVASGARRRGRRGRATPCASSRCAAVPSSTACCDRPTVR